MTHRLSTVCALALVACLFAPQSPSAQESHPHPHDAAVAAPHHHKILLENESVRVFETRIPAGEPAGKVLFDSRTIASKPPPGSALWSAPVGPHYIHNVGTTELLVIAVELKRQ